MDHDLQGEIDRLQKLVDDDPARAIAGARRLWTGNEPIDGRLSAACAGILIDAGRHAEDQQAVQDGIDRLEALIDEGSLQDISNQLKYYVANGLLAAADLTPKLGSRSWYVATQPLRAQARSLLTEVGTSGDAPAELRTQALTNLGNTLSQAHRYVEAYDAYRDALQARPGFGMAALNAAVALGHIQQRGLAGAHTDTRRRELLEVANNDRRGIERIGGRPAVLVLDRHIDGLAEPPEQAAPSVSESTLGAEAKWIACNHLALVPGVESFRPELVRWDSLGLYPYVEAVATPPTPPVAFAMFNVMKQSYMLARRMAYQATKEGVEPDTSQYADTLDYALWGQQSALLIESQKIAIGVLDRIAVATNDELSSEMSPYTVHFHSYWEHNTSKPHLDREIEAGNVAVIALRDLAADMAEDRALHGQRDARNAATHRFVVLHDMAFEGYVRESPAVDRYDFDEFVNLTIRSLQLARAALIHFTELLGSRSARLDSPDSNLVVPLVLPPHHQVRGEDDPSHST